MPKWGAKKDFEIVLLHVYNIHCIAIVSIKTRLLSFGFIHYICLFLHPNTVRSSIYSMTKLTHNISVGSSFSEVGGGAWQSTVDSWLRWLAQLHTVLELVSTVHTTLNTPTLVQVTSLALSTFLRPESPITSLLHLINNRFYELRTPIVTKDVKSFIDG